MGFLVPDITKPLVLRLTPEDARMEALGRTLGLAGATAGIIGGVMILTANPAFKAVVSKGTGLSMTLLPGQIKQEAWGKVLATLGMGVGLAGTVLTMTAQPDVKSKLGAVYAKMPNALKANRKMMFGIAAVGILGLTAWMLRSQNAALFKRYSAA